MRVVATAGHVDHGKSSLVLALTGTDPDRFPEEKSRGLTIDLGFAFTESPAGESVGFVDVPGHVRFVKNMLAGVGAVDVAMLVVAANEGWMPQTEEHARILDLLGIAHGLVVLTKADLVDTETLELARLELEDHLAGSLLAHWPVVTTSTATGHGIGDLRRTLDVVLAGAPEAVDLGRPRLWIDRTFSVKGAGTVVTGTLTGGCISTGDDVIVEPGARTARVRGIESRGEQVTTASPGSRVALNLSGIEHHGVGRGDAVVRPGEWVTPAVVDVAVVRIPGEEMPRSSRVVAHAGSGEHPARFRFLDDTGRFGRLRLASGLPLTPGDRIVLRSSARRATVGGAEVLDLEPARRSADAARRLTLPPGGRALAARQWLTLADLALLTGLGESGATAAADALTTGGTAERVGDWIVDAGAIRRTRDMALERVVEHHERHPHDSGTRLAELASLLGIDPARLRAALAGVPDLIVERETVRHRSHRESALDDPEARRLLDALEASPFAPPSPSDAGASAAVTRSLLREGLAVEIDGVVFAASALDAARRIASRALVERGSLTVADLRDLLGSTRKYVLPIAGHLDAEGVTRRRGDDRLPGPRAVAIDQESDSAARPRADTGADAGGA
ncbi:MAG: selenocysteine-specific translation elongation factor [Acidimicrobiia bacterium]|nr:selenocysteine-specific translation elongation factor [Acidimicrobiia bacterium]